MNKEKKEKCPSCGSTDIVRIAYGYPGPEMVEEAEKGTIVLGGCVISEDNPYSQCKSCGTQW